MDGSLLAQLVVFLAVAAIAAPFARMCKLGSILGYLFAGAAIGPYGFGPLLFGYHAFEPEAVRHIAELGVAMFLFLIGLELRPRRLLKMREAILAAGGVQVAVTGILLAGLIWEINGSQSFSFPEALLIGLTLALSSTAFALQTLEEKKEITSRHGRLAFSILLFQDVAAVALIAVIPLFNKTGAAFSVVGILKLVAAIAIVIIAGHYLLDRVYGLLASTGVREAMLAAALLTVAGVSWLMTEIGLSTSLGAFLAGVLLADSSFRHQLEADIQPFQMLLLALFFTSIGMSLNYHALLSNPGVIVEGVAGLVAVKFAVLYAIGRWQGLDNSSSRRLAIVTSQGGEFAFVVFAGVQRGGILGVGEAETLVIIVTLSMVTTPILLALDDLIRNKLRKAERAFDELPKSDGHVVIAGFGRVGQVIGRILRARGIRFIALDSDPETVNTINQFGNKIYYGDPSRLSILEAAEIHKARAFVLAIDDVEKSLKTAQLVRTYFPHVPIYARARNRKHVHQLMDLGVKHIERETFLASIELTRDLLQGLGLPKGEIRFILDAFRAHDEQRLYADYAHYTDTEKMVARARKQSEELAEIFQRDWRLAEAENAKREEESRKAQQKVKAAPDVLSSEKGKQALGKPV